MRDIGINQALYARLFFVALTLTAALATAFAYGYGGVRAAQGTMAVGTVVAMTAYLARLYAPLTQLSNVNLDVMTTLVSFERIFEVLDLVPMLAEDARRRGQIPRGPATVEFDHVRFSYPSAEDVSLASLEAVAVLEAAERTEVLHEVSFTVEPGQMVALVGPSGAGKTTISNLVPRLYDATSGSVRINGVDVRHATMSSVRDAVGVVTQDPHLFHDTLRANLLYARPEATDDDLLRSLELAQILHLVATLPDGLDTVVGERGYRLSGGEKQRVALARLILKAPDVVVLDEATAHLDSESEAAVQEALRLDPGRSHLGGHRPPPLDRARGRRTAGHRRRADRRARHPPPAAGRRRPLRRALPHPVRRPGHGERPRGLTAGRSFPPAGAGRSLGPVSTTPDAARDPAAGERPTRRG